MSVYSKNFHQNLVSLIDVISDIINSLNERGHKTGIDSLIMAFAKNYVTNLDPNSCLEGFALGAFEHLKKIKERDIDFFSSNAGSLFKGLPENYINKFSSIFTLRELDGEPYHGDLTPDDSKENRVLWAVHPMNIEDLWDRIHLMVAVSIKHIHKSRVPKKNDAGVKEYTVDYMPEINLTDAKAIWKGKA